MMPMEVPTIHTNGFADMALIMISEWIQISSTFGTIYVTNTG